MAITKKTNKNWKKKPNPNIGGDVEKVLHLWIDGGNAKWCSHYGTQYGGSSKKKKIKHRITVRKKKLQVFYIF